MHDPAVPPYHVKFGPFELDVRSGELRKGPTRLKVPDQSIEILNALVEHPGELVTREQLRERLWPANTFVDFEHGLNAAIRRLREALGDSADSPKYIETLPRRGYRFIGSVEGVPTSVAVPQALVPIEPPSAERRVEPPARTPVHVRRLTTGHLALMVLIVLTIGIGLYFIRRGSDRPSYDVSAALKSVPVTSLPGSEVEPSLSPDGNYLAFAWEGDAGDNFDIYVKQLDVGAGLIQLTTNAAGDRAPAWSPDGRSIAFVRYDGDKAEAIVVPASGGAEQRLTGITGLSSGLSWTPDGKSLVFVGGDGSTDFAVFTYTPETGERRRLTQPPPAGIPDTASGQLSAAPVISPDGRYLAYIGSRWKIVVQRLDDALRPVGAPKALTEDGWVFSLAWAHDSSSIVYDIGGRWGGVPKGLWRVPIAGGQPRPLFPNVRASMPSLASNGRHLVYQNTTRDTNIWRMPGPQRHNEAESGTPPDKFIASNELDMSPQISPDGRRIAFVSTRSGYYELWLADTDRPAAPRQLTKFNGPFVGSPRWNTNGDLVAFDSTRSGSFNIWVVAGDGTGARPITNDSSINVRPSWSRDGRWIYFSSQRSGDLQIWKIPAAGGEPFRVTKKGGAQEALESPDGKHLYYAKTEGLPGIWRVPVDGGDEMQVIDHGSQGWWAVIDGGIVLMNKGRPKATVEYFSVDTARITWTRQLPAGLRFELNPGFSVSRDGQWMLFTLVDKWGSDIHMLQ